MTPSNNCSIIVCWILVLLIQGITANTNELKIITDFHSCFQASLGILKDKLGNLAPLANPETDTSVIASIYPPIQINMTDIPTEFNNSDASENIFPGNLSSDSDDLQTNLDFPPNSVDLLSIPKIFKKDKIRYLLFTEDNKIQYQVMPEDGTIVGTRWRPERQTKVLIHGLTSSIWLPPMFNIWTQHIFQIKDGYLKRSKDSNRYNVVVVDWTSLSTVSLSRYPEAAIATKDAGDDLAQFLFNLRESNNILNWEDVHLLGHSLGAHVAGIAGSELRKRGEQYTLQRITGLDPAGLCFDTFSGLVEEPDTMLDTSDAKFVDIIHTNMGNIIKSVAGKYGSQMQTGHADFYPNGGEAQNGCTFLEDRLNFCSHQKSVVFYAESISDKVVACPCSNWDVFRTTACKCNFETGGQYMGEYCNSSARGKYFLNM